MHFYIILKLHFCHNFNKILIILYICGITLIYINILPFIFDNLHSTRHGFDMLHFLQNYELTSECVRSESLTTVTITNTLFRGVPPCSLVRIYGRFGRNFSLSLKTWRQKQQFYPKDSKSLPDDLQPSHSAISSRKSTNFYHSTLYHTTLHNISVDHCIYFRLLLVHSAKQFYQLYLPTKSFFDSQHRLDTWPLARPCFVYLCSMNIDRFLLLVYNTDQQDTWSRITGFIFQLISPLKETYRSLHHHLTRRRGSAKGDERQWRHTTRNSTLQKPLRDFLYLFLCLFFYQNRK